jgi:hypothetical protein
MKNQIQIFKAVTRAVDAVNGTICVKGTYADETSSISVSSLIPYFARDIYLAQKDEPLLRTRMEFKVVAGVKCPSIEVSLSEGILEEDFKKIQLHLTQILWSYNFIKYDARIDCLKQRFSYAFVFTPVCYSLKEVA